MTWFCKEPFFRHFREYPRSTIRDAGGVPVPAHPHHLTQYIGELAARGLPGAEYSRPLPEVGEPGTVKSYAKKYNLNLCGGTGHHGQMGGEENRFPDQNNACHTEPCRYGVSEEDFLLLKNHLKG